MLLSSTLREMTNVSKIERSIRLVADNTPAKATFENIAVVGLGYVGLPLAVSLSGKFKTVTGFDISGQRIREIKQGHDTNNEIDAPSLTSCGLRVSDELTVLTDASFYIVTVPTPINEAREPDLEPLHYACKVIGPNLKKDDVVVFESTVYPGVTEDICAPILERISGLKAGKDFGLGYSPERINPGDKVNTVENVVKVVSGDTPKTLARVKAVYELVVNAGLHCAPNIKVAEASKALENTQRDVNIALMNEMSLICDKIGIDTNEVIDAAATKWNFMRFTPGLVGGHCIGVDPYYLASLAHKIGHNPQVIMAGRRTNDSMVRHIADATLRLMIEKGGAVKSMRVGICGITFKENVPDLRNSKSVELISFLRGYGITPLIHDPHCSPEAAKAIGVELCTAEEMSDLDVMVLATAHQPYVNDPHFLNKIREQGILIDVKGVFRNSRKAETLTYWSL